MKRSSYLKDLEEQEIEDLIAGCEIGEEKWDSDWGDIDEYYGKNSDEVEVEEEEEEDGTDDHTPQYSSPSPKHKGRKGKGGKGKGWGKGGGNKRHCAQWPSSAGSQLAIVPAPASITRLTKVDRASILGICEHVQRTESALRAALTVAQGAQTAFQNEMQTLHSIRGDLDRIARTMP